MCVICDVFNSVFDDIDSDRANDCDDTLRNAAGEIMTETVASALQDGVKKLNDAETTPERRAGMFEHAFLIGYLFGQRLTLNQEFALAKDTPEQRAGDEAARLLQRIGKLDDKGPGPDDTVQ